MYKKHDNRIGGVALCIIVQKVGETIIIMIGRKTRVSVSRGLQVWPFFSLVNFSQSKEISLKRFAPNAKAQGVAKPLNFGQAHKFLWDDSLCKALRDEEEERHSGCSD